MPVITGITVSVSFSDKEYGKGSENFMNASAKWGEDAPTFEQLDTVIDRGLELYFTAWKTMLGSRFATGNMGAANFKKLLADSELRMEMVRKYLAKGVIQP
jgi:hypothetical protein